MNSSQDLDLFQEAAMRRRTMRRLHDALLGVLLLTSASTLRAQSLGPCDPPPVAPEGSIPRQQEGDAVRESEISKVVDGEPEPQISFIDSPTAVCYQPDPAEDLCYINWYYLSVSASPDYMICMEVTINAVGKVAYYSGFFQTSMYAPYGLHGRGFRVSCGSLGAGGYSTLGNAYAYTIRARDSSSLRSANYGTVYCPAYTP